MISKSTTTLKDGDVVRYETLDRPNRHCREGVAIAQSRRGELVLIDTFWSLGTESHVLTADEKDTSELVFNVHDYDELDEYSGASSAIWRKYAPVDRERITSQHGLCTRWFVRKGAVEDLATQIAFARERVDSADVEVRSAQRSLDRAREDLATLEQKAGAPDA